MRVVRVEFPATLLLADDANDMTSPDVRRQIAEHVRSCEPGVVELISSRARNYFPENYNVFTVLRTSDDVSKLAVEMWVVDPTIRWWGGLFARRAWHVILPVLSRIAQSALDDGLQPIRAVTQEAAARVSIFGTMRTWKDPLVLAIFILVLTSAFWLGAQRYLGVQLY